MPARKQSSRHYPVAMRRVAGNADSLREMGEQIRGGEVELSALTKSSNPADPRTSAAGYDRQTRTLRVEWGDGGPSYNYYEVEPAIARRFVNANSPGRFINSVLNKYPYGPVSE